MGEVIPIELSFTSSIAKRYQINMAGYDRSGRMHYETFQVTPKEATRDPLHDYFAFGGFIGGGLTSFRFLGAEPVIIKLTLNEWIRFERPGIYRLKVTSARVSVATLNGNEADKSGRITSNEIELEIVAADKEWQQRQLESIEHDLDDSKRKADMPGKPNEALTRLRFLGTEEAARKMARRFGTADANADFQYMFGLLGSPNAAAGLAEMSVLLHDPDVPVTGLFLQTMSYLPLRNGDSPDILRKQVQANIDSNRVALLAALPVKRGKAQAVSAETALDGVAASAPESLRKPLSQQLLRNFESLPVESQANWLQYKWDLIRDPAWIPVLRKIATSYTEFPQLREMHAYQSLQASGAALKRWYELDPEGARNAVVAEITRILPRYGADVLGFLKDASLPETEPGLVENLARTDNYETEGNLLGLLERYGTGAAVSQLIALRGHLVGKWACTPQESFLGYLLKFDPQAARPLIEHAIEARGQDSNACRHTLFMELGGKHESPVLEEVAVRSLNDPDPEVAANAAAYLGRYGSEAAEQPLWTRYIAWNRQWLGREKDLRITSGAGENPNVWEANLGQALANALAQGNGWFCDDAKLNRALDLAVSEYVRSTVESARREASGRSIQFSRGLPNQPGWFSLAQYDQLTLEQLRKKLQQFPSGEVVHWASPEEEKAFREVSDAAAKAGIKLVRDPPATVP
jgi:hypothetical protein